MSNPLLSLSSARVAGEPIGVYSICSAHPWVIEASISQAIDDGGSLVIEATSNQVNHAGGYTGMTPAEFKAFVFKIADRLGFDKERLVLGGDHLGPNPWRHLNAAEAMDHAKETVRQYVAAGFSKIHLDTSMACAGEVEPLDEAVIAARAAELCAVAERGNANPAPLYIIGTEVPPPGGAQHELQAIELTSPEAARRAIEVHRQAFLDKGLEQAWSRVIALVVQPGLEFGDTRVIDYVPEKSRDLCRLLQEEPKLVFEAHSTDYQSQQTYTELVRDGFAILKVGPALTFAMREALAALEDIERQLVPAERHSQLFATIESVMLHSPKNWQSHYHGSEHTKQLLRMYSYSDRMRYYWHEPPVSDAVARLMTNLQAIEIPEVMLSRYLPEQYEAIRSGTLSPDPQSLIQHKIRQVIRRYAHACNVQ
jgi:D-tagatose-1,6-bisphosphate aldolase subunit GatZ/KbaZ